MSIFLALAMAFSGATPLHALAAGSIAGAVQRVGHSTLREAGAL
jgi:hypothetical protein